MLLAEYAESSIKANPTPPPPKKERAEGCYCNVHLA